MVKKSGISDVESETTEKLRKWFFNRPAWTLWQAAYLLCWKAPESLEAIQNYPDVLDMLGEIESHVKAGNLETINRREPIAESDVTMYATMLWARERLLQSKLPPLLVVWIRSLTELGEHFARLSNITTPVSAQDWEMWLMLDSWTVDEAAHLLLGVSPRANWTDKAITGPGMTPELIYSWLKTSINDPDAPYPLKAAKGSTGTFGNKKILVANAIQWARRRGLPLPSKIDAHAQSLNQAKAVEDRAGGEHVSDSLSTLNQAARKFWGGPNIRKDDPDTHPDNADVAEWLVVTGKLSPSLAEKAATIIRPHWAFRGRRKGPE